MGASRKLGLMGGPGSEYGPSKRGERQIGDPEVDVWLVIPAVADQVIATIVPQADVRMTAVVLADPLAAIEHLPMQSVHADAVIESTVVAMDHVGEEVGIVLRRFTRPNLSRRVGHLGMAQCRPKKVGQYPPPGEENDSHVI